MINPHGRPSAASDWPPTRRLTDGPAALGPPELRRPIMRRSRLAVLFARSLPLARRRCRLPALLASLTIATTAPPAWCAWSHDIVTNLQVAPQVPAQDDPAVVGDGQGGAFILFMDLRAGNFDIYAQHVNAKGAIVP